MQISSIIRTRLDASPDVRTEKRNVRVKFSLFESLQADVACYQGDLDEMRKDDFELHRAGSPSIIPFCRTI